MFEKGKEGSVIARGDILPHNLDVAHTKPSNLGIIGYHLSTKEGYDE
jgi:hypothetical protein